MPDTINSLTDAEMVAVASQIKNELGTHLADYIGVTAATVTALTNSLAAFPPKIDAAVASKAQSKSDTTAKNAERAVMDGLIRSIRNVAKAGGTTQENMDLLGIPQGDASAPSNATVPVLSVDTSQRLQHTLSWVEAEAPNNKRKPRGIVGAEIWRKIDGPPPIDETQCQFLTLDTESPYLVPYSGTDAGKMAHYMCRWLGRDGQPRPWAETVSATITG